MVSDGNEAVDACASHPFDIVLMDVMMPNLDGISATTAIRQQEKEELQRSLEGGKGEEEEDEGGSSDQKRTKKKRMRIIALTACADAQTQQECKVCGMDGLLLKPFRKSDLLNVLRSTAADWA